MSILLNISVSDLEKVIYFAGYIITKVYEDEKETIIQNLEKEYKSKLGVLEKQCKVVGRNFDEIEKSCWPGGQVIIAHNHKELSEKISQRKLANANLEDFRKCILAGTPDECIEQLQVYVGLGVTCFMLFFNELPKLDGLKLFAENVINKMS